MIIKECSKCGEEKHVSEFSKSKRSRCGFQRNCKDCDRNYYQENKRRIYDYREERREKNREYAKKYRQENKERVKEYQKHWYEENKERVKERTRKYKKKQWQSDPIFRLKNNLRRRTARAFRDEGFSKNSKTKEMLGVEWEIVKKHIERQFTKGMNWDNYGEWHIDHIIPLSSAKTEEEVVKLCHYSNLQPLWAEDNFSKSDNIEPTQVKLRL